MAWRNIWRRKRRTFITCFSVSFGLLYAVLSTGFGDWGYTKLIDDSASMGYGHVTFEPVDYNVAPSLDKRIPNTKELRERVQGVKGVSVAIERIMGQAMLASASKSVGGMFFAIDPAQESKEYNLFIKKMVEGELFTGTDGRGVVVGVKLAEKLGLRIGKKLIYTFTDVNGEIVSEIARVTGMFKTGSDQADGAIVLLPIDRVRNILGYAQDEATLVAVIIKDQRRAAGMAEKLDSLFGDGMDVLPFTETQKDVTSMIFMDKSMNYLFQIFLGLLVSAGILNTILMAVLERTREFGIMMAIGMSPKKLFQLVLTESFWIGLVGLIMGIVISAPIYYYFSTTGLDLAGMVPEGYSAGNVPFDLVMKIKLFPESVVAILSIVFLLTLLAGLYPAYKAGKVPPVESIRVI
jgi:ABC-type lipoprotein release transport system permease subunit